MKVRRAALNRIGENTIRTGAPMATIEEPLVPIYMYHRYAVEAAASMIGGQDFIYAMRGDGRHADEVGVAANQRKALDALAATLKPSELTMPKKILDLIPPRPPGFGHAPRAVPAHDRRRLRSAQSRPRSPPTSRSASCCSPIAPRAWSRRTRSTSRCPGSVK